MKRTRNFFIALLGFCLMGSGVMAQTSLNYYDDVENGVTYRIEGDYAVASVYEELDVANKTFVPVVIVGSLNLKGSVIISGKNYIVKKIGKSGFADQTKITSLTLPSSVTIIDERAFENCTSITSLDLSYVSTIGKDAFYSCTNLGSLKVGNIASKGAGAFDGTNIKTLNFADNLTSVPASITSGFAAKLTTVDLHKGITSIGDSAFQNCASLEYIALNDVRVIEKGAFSSCTRLNTIDGLPLVEAIGESAFSGCVSLTSVNLNSLQTLGSSAFSGCGTTDFNTGTTRGLQTVTLPIGLKELPNAVFYGCSNLSDVKVTGGDVNSAFGNFETIGAGAFASCNSLSGVIGFSSALTSIGATAFNGVANVTEFQFKSNPKIGNGAFGASVTRNLYLTDYNIKNVHNGNSNTYTEVIYTRPLSTTNQYAGIVLPFAPVKSDDYVLYQLGRMSGNQIVFDEVTAPVANRPYLLENIAKSGNLIVKASNYNPAGSSLQAEEVTADSWTSHGVYESTTFTPGAIKNSGQSYYSIQGGAFKRFDNVGLDLKPCRTYWTYSGPTLNAVMLRTSRGDVTAIDLMEIDNEQNLGQNYYDLTGRKVLNPVKGNIYIVKGKKVVF